VKAWSITEVVEAIELVEVEVVGKLDDVTGEEGAELLMMMPDCVPVIEDVTVSVTVKDCVPVLLKVALKVCVPASVTVNV
jgi:hypothetical protein